MTDQTNPTPTGSAINLFRVLTAFAAAGTVVAAALTFAAFAARHHWRLEQACHFRVQYFWCLLLAAVVLWAAKRPRIATLALLASLTNFVVIVPIYWPVKQPNNAGPKLRVISFNMLRDNPQHEAVTPFLTKAQADIILLMEVTPEWAKPLTTLSDTYPHQHLVPRSDAFGIALLSRHPWKEIETIDLIRNELPSIVAKFDYTGTPFTFIGTHPLPPGSPSTAQERNSQLAAVAKFVRKQSTPTILAGDLNLTDFSPYFHDLLAVSNFRDTRQGRGLQPTWGPLHRLQTSLLEIPIDHCLVSPQITTLNRHTAPHLGSDHRPVIIDLALPPQ
jgi:endonuclease/exonuclease/phosphatase (EEP) superfamily protein YafD